MPAEPPASAVSRKINPRVTARLALGKVGTETPSGTKATGVNESNGRPRPISGAAI